MKFMDGVLNQQRIQPVDLLMRVFVPFSEELFEYAGRHAVPAQSTASVPGRSGAAQVPETADLGGLGELVPFRFDYRCLRMKAQPRTAAHTS